MRPTLHGIAHAAWLSLVLGQVADCQVRTQSLTEFEGRYEYRDGATLFMVSSGQRLIAIIGEARYPLRTAGPDAFTNPGGDPIPFLRDTSGRVMAFREKNDSFKRLSSDAPSEVRLLMEPRPNRDGRSVTYRYK